VLHSIDADIRAWKTNQMQSIEGEVIGIQRHNYKYIESYYCISDWFREMATLWNRKVIGTASLNIISFFILSQPHNTLNNGTIVSSDEGDSFFD
jgi:hypothetical protein